MAGGCNWLPLNIFCIMQETNVTTVLNNDFIRNKLEIDELEINLSKQQYLLISQF
jgi:hypothetical protein